MPAGMRRHQHRIIGRRVTHEVVAIGHEAAHQNADRAPAPCGQVARRQLGTIDLAMSCGARGQQAVVHREALQLRQIETDHDVGAVFDLLHGSDGHIVERAPVNQHLAIGSIGRRQQRAGIEERSADRGPRSLRSNGNALYRWKDWSALRRTGSTDPRC